MKRDWDVIREVLLEVEAHDAEDPNELTYAVGPEEGFSLKAQHALLLWKEGFIEGVNGSTLSGHRVFVQSLSWGGHDLLDTLRSKSVWERVKKTSAEKGIELSF